MKPTKKVNLSTLVIMIMLFIIIVSVFTWWNTRKTLPPEIHIAAGIKGGQYYHFSQLLREHLSRLTKRKVVVHETAGSNENFDKLNNDSVHLAIIQLGPLGVERHEIITPLYPEVVQVVVRRESQIKSLADLESRRVGVSVHGSGMRDSALKLLAHAGLTDKVNLEEKYLTALESDPELDAVILTAGLVNEDVNKLMQTGRYRLLNMPSAEGLALRQPFFRPYAIPKGFYFGGRSAVPEKIINTIATMAVLAGSKDLDEKVIAATLQSIYETDINFNIPVLLNRQQAYEWSLYPKHPAANAYFNPYEGIDLLAAFMESLSAGKELIVALFAGLYLFWDMAKRRRQKRRESELTQQKEHLDTYLDKTIIIERAQLDTNNAKQLESYLDEVTNIKLAALEEFTNEDLRADQAFQIFLIQCANLSRKIQNKLQMCKLDIQSTGSDSITE